MNINRLLKIARNFELLAIAEKEELPENSKDKKVILKNIEELTTYDARKKYAEKNFKHLSSGSSRIVYLTKDKTVVKLAKNDKGIAQNKAEVKNLKIKSKYLNDILDFAKNYSWVETPYLNKLTEKQFEKITGINFGDFGDSLRYALKSISGSKIEKPENYNEIAKSEIFKELRDFGKKCRLMAGDLAKISSYLVKDNHPVLIDAGLTKKIFDEFYDS